MQRLYWHGNAAKIKIVDAILSRTADARAAGETVLIFEYGCGGGGDWPTILSENKGFRVIGYEPHGPSYQRALKRLGDLPMTVFTGDELRGQSFSADYIVSFSVFEHVYDRAGYLATAKRLLARDGTFYLNYDDGHFRNLLDLGARSTWGSSLSEFAHNLLAPFLARVGKVGYYQRRVPRALADRLAREAGFRVEGAFYSNLGSFKAIAKTLPADKQEAFSRLWMEVEDTLNKEFSVERDAHLGDTMNLWRSMASRTLILRH